VTSASVEVIEPADRWRGVAALTLAFAGDQFTRWAWPDPYQFATYWPRIAEGYAGRAFDCGTAHVLENFAAVALWLPPGAGSDEAAFGELIAESYGGQIPGDFSAVGEQMAQFHPAGELWYLPMIGVDPVAQGRGLGSALLRHGLAACDRAGLPPTWKQRTRATGPCTSVTDSGSSGLSRQDHHRRCGRCCESPCPGGRDQRPDPARTSGIGQPCRLHPWPHTYHLVPGLHRRPRRRPDCHPYRRVFAPRPCPASITDRGLCMAAVR